MTSIKKGNLTPFSLVTTYNNQEGENWYHPVVLSPSTLGEMATSPETLKKVMKVLNQLVPDEYTKYLNNYYKKGLDSFQSHWRYADIVTALYSAATLIKPKTYLEVGVRRGRSMAMVAATNPQCQIYGFDMWIENYAGINNPGTGFVKSEMDSLKFEGELKLISGNSHETIPEFFKRNPELFFDIITIDGDHTPDGALKDFDDLLPRLKIGGAVIFDDIQHPSHPYLADIWKNKIEESSNYSSWKYTELGYGVGIAIKKEHN